MSNQSAIVGVSQTREKLVADGAGHKFLDIAGDLKYIAAQ